MCQQSQNEKKRFLLPPFVSLISSLFIFLLYFWFVVLFIPLACFLLCLGYFPIHLNFLIYVLSFGSTSTVHFHWFICHYSTVTNAGVWLCLVTLLMIVFFVIYRYNDGNFCYYFIPPLIHIYIYIYMHISFRVHWWKWKQKKKTYIYTHIYVDFFFKSAHEIKIKKREEWNAEVHLYISVLQFLIH